MTDLPNLIGLSGVARSGKDTLAAGLAQYGYKRLAFADPLKEMAVTLNPIVDSQGTRLADVVTSDGWESVKDRYPEARRILQFLGTEVVRAIKQDHWVEITREAIAAGGRFVVTDVRFESEAEMIRQMGGIVVEIFRPSLPKSKDAHISEAGVVADWVVVNSGTREDLYREFMREIGDL